MLTDKAKLDKKYFLGTYSIIATRKLLNYYNRELAELGLTVQQAIAIRIVWLGDGLSQVEFARQMDISKPSALNLLKRMERRGLVTKKPHPDNKSTTVIEVTKKTLKMIPQIQEKVLNLENELESQFGVLKLKKFVKELTEFTHVEF